MSTLTRHPVEPYIAIRAQLHRVEHVYGLENTELVMGVIIVLTVNIPHGLTVHMQLQIIIHRLKLRTNVFKGAIWAPGIYLPLKKLKTKN